LACFVPRPTVDDGVSRYGLSPANRPVLAIL